VVALLALVLSALLMAGGRTDVANWVLSAVILLTTGLTYLWVLPQPGRLLVVRQDELDVSDLIFFVHESVPRDYLLQLHVAVCNVGGRKAVLSSLRLNALLDAAGHAVQGLEFPGWLNAEEYVQIMRRRIENQMRREPYSETRSGPWVLESDDVITLRFRSRQGIDWSPQWDLERLRRLATALETEVCGGRLELAYRCGRTVVRESVDVDCKVEQQHRYREAILEATAGLKSVPRDLEVAVDIE
jgi:hypothetical protein